MAFDFHESDSVYGEDFDQVSGVLAKQVVAAASHLGIECSTPAEFRDAYAEQEEIDPSLVGIEIWEATAEGATDPTFTLIYFPDTDGGVLFHAGTAGSAGLLLWPDGFKPLEGVRAAADAASLSEDYRAARRRGPAD